MDEQLFTLAQAIGEQLQSRQIKLALAESCTGGLAAGAITEIPGASAYFCGSAVTYREETKATWLKVSRAVLNDPKLGAVSPIAAELMCHGVLAGTPEADVAAAITGHLGPDAPAKLDGTVFIGICWRGDASPVIQRRTLTASLQSTSTPRFARRRQAVEVFLDSILLALKSRG